MLEQTEGRSGVQDVLVTVSPDGTKFLTQDSSMTAVYDMATGEQIAETENTAFVDRSDSRVYMEVSRQGNSVSRNSTSYPFPTEAKFSPDGQEIIIATFAGFMRWDYENDQLTTPIWVRTEEIDDLMHVSYFPGGRYLLGGLEGDKNFGIWDLEADEITGTAPFRSGNLKKEFIESEISAQNLIAVVGKNRPDTTTVSLIDPVSQKTRGLSHEVMFEFAERDVQIQFSPDGSLLAVGDTVGTLLLLNGTTGGKIVEWSAHAGAINGLAFSPDGTRMATGGEDGVMRVWHIGDGGS